MIFMKIFFLAVILLLAGCAAPATEHVFLITIDGARPDILQEVETPFIDKLIEAGAAYSFDSQTVCPSLTPPTHASLFTGVTPDLHEYYYPGDDPQIQTIFERFEARGYSTLLLDGKGGRIRGLERGVRYYEGSVNHYHLFADGTLAVDSVVMNSFIGLFARSQPFFSFILLPAVDYSGHTYGADSQQYAASISNADAAIGMLLEYLVATDIFENSVIVIVADHGMTGFHHSDCTPTDMAIPIIKYGNGFSAGEYSWNITDVPLSLIQMFDLLD